MTRPTLELGPPCRTARSLAVDGVRHGFFGRQGGTSEGLFESLNCGFGSSDARLQVTANRARVAKVMGIESAHLLTVHQIHSAHVVTVNESWSPADSPQADAMVTNQPGIGLGVLAADCAPVLFADAEAGCIGAAHSGWRGAFDGVLEATVKAMEALGARPDRIRAVIGPCISKVAYEVGPEFVERFDARNPEWTGYFHPSDKEGHSYFDLPQFALDRLQAAGLEMAETLDLCTYQHKDAYFSYRRTTHQGEPDYGRNISVIALTD